MKKAAIIVLALFPAVGWSQAKYSSPDEALAAKDYPAAIELLRKEARRGDLRSAQQIGMLYRDGEGVAKDPVQALEWFLRAAKPDIRRARFKNGLPEAQLEAAKMYRDGIGTAPDAKRATRWYRLAAEQDRGDAQLALAELYLRGQGVAPDYAAAYRWASLAHNSLAGEEADLAARLRDEAAEHLSEQELAELQKEIDKDAGPQAL